MKLAPFDWQVLKEPIVIGVDEVGRGCLAGDVYAAAVWFPKETLIDGLKDSKLISASKRDIYFDLVKKSCAVGVGTASVSEIEKHNIRVAALLAMKRAVEALNLKKEEFLRCHVLVDGRDTIPGLQCKQTALIKGDLRAAPISAASVIAKVTRDRDLEAMAKEFPEYGFDAHKGYGTKDHKDAIRKFGPSSVHRLKFSGVKEFC